MRLGVVVECRRVDHPWQPWRWRAIGVLVEPPETASWRVLVKDEHFTQYHAANLELALFRDETDHYKYNLSSDRPQLYVVMRETGADDFPWRPVRLSASPWEGQAFEELAEDRVDAVAMPPVVIGWVKEFVDRFHVERPFYKRKRKGRDAKPGEGSTFVPLGGGEGEG